MNISQSDIKEMLIEGFRTSNDNLIKEACLQAFRIVERIVDRLMISHGFKGEINLDDRLDFLMELDKELNRQYSYFHQIIYGAYYYRGKFLSEKIMLEDFQEAEDFVKICKS